MPDERLGSVARGENSVVGDWGLFVNPPQKEGLKKYSAAFYQIVEAQKLNFQ